MRHFASIEAMFRDIFRYYVVYVKKNGQRHRIRHARKWFANLWIALIFDGCRFTAKIVQKHEKQTTATAMQQVLSLFLMSDMDISYKQQST